MAWVVSEIYLPIMVGSESWTLQAEKDLVTCLSLMPLGPDTAERAGRLLGGQLDWNAIIDIAARWNVDAVVFGNLRSSFAERIPDGALAEISERERTARAHALSRTLLTDELVRDLAANEIASLVFKGPALAAILYGDCSRRPFGDLDLLIRRDDMRRAHDLLIGRGFVASYSEAQIDSLVNEQHALELGGPNLKVELHWSLLSRFLRFDLESESLWKDAQSVRCADFTLTTLSRPHHFLYLCAHGAKHEWVRFRWIVDVAQFARRLNGSEAEEITRLAARTNTRRILALALNLTNEIFGEQAPAFSRDAFGRRRETERLVDAVRSSLGLTEARPRPFVSTQLEKIHPYVRTMRFWIRARERIEDRVVAVARLVFRRATP